MSLERQHVMAERGHTIPPDSTRGDELSDDGGITPVIWFEYLVPNAVIWCGFVMAGPEAFASRRTGSRHSRWPRQPLL